jgi:hypothetical protein
VPGFRPNQREIKGNGMTGQLDYSETWADARALLRAHGEGLAAIAGVFLLVPEWTLRMLVTQTSGDEPSGLSEMMALMQQQFLDHWHIMVPVLLIKLFGTVALYVLLTRRELPRIGDALTTALPIIPFYIAAEILVGVATILATLALIIPGLYLMGRLTPMGSILVAEHPRDPIGAIRHAWNLTRNKGWAIFFLLFIVSLVMVLLSFVLELLVGLPSKLLSGPDGIPMLQHGVGAMTATVMTVVIAALTVAIYRNLAGLMTQR